MDILNFLPSLTPLGVFGFLAVLLATAAAIGAHRIGLFDLLSKVDTTSKNHGGQLVANTLKAHGVKFVFTLCGGHISPILAACEKLGIRVVDTRHEVTCVFAADAVARLSGVVGVACVTAGPGLTNTVTAVKNASMAESPVLLLGGAAAGILKGRGALQDIDQMALFKPICKYTATVTRIRDIVPTLRTALCIAQSGTPGPVFVEFPIDTLYPYELIAQEILPKNKPKSILHYITFVYIHAYVKRLFAGAWDVKDSSPLPVTRPFASTSDIKRSAYLVRKAKKPVILLGSQATLPPTCASDLQAALEKMGIPCFLGGMTRGMLGRNSDIHIRQKRRDAIKEADLVIMAGAVADFRLSYGRILHSRLKIIAVNRNKTSLYMNTDSTWRPTIALQVDPGAFLVSLSQALADYKCNPEWPRTLKMRDIEKEEANLRKSDEVPKEHLNPLKVLHYAEEVMSEDTIMVADGGDFVGSAAYILRPRGPLRWLDPGAFGTLGVGGGFALGAKLCCPDADVWIIYGDGSLGYSVAEFDTFSRHKLPMIALVGNDACWTQIAREQVPMFGTSVGCVLTHCSYETVAEGYGGKGYLLERQHKDKEIKKILAEAQTMSQNGRPVLVNCLIGRTDFREGSISV